MKNKSKVESFSLDHTKVKAPYIRLAGITKTKHGDVIYKYDLRFTQPNKRYIPIAVMHTLEHLLAISMRNYLDGILDLGPMGCRTGFYLLAFDPYDDILKCLEKSLKDCLKTKSVPYANSIQCGGAKNHDLAGAKKYAQKMLEGKENWTIGWKEQSKPKKKKSI